jgi:hypothetical protein
MVALAILLIAGCADTDEARLTAMGSCQMASFKGAEPVDRTDFIKACMLSKGYVFDGGSQSEPLCSADPASGQTASKTALYHFNPKDERCYSHK